MSPLDVTTGSGLTVTVTVSAAAHNAPGFTLIIYCVVAAGVAKGLNTPGLDNPVAGDQLYVVPLTAVVTSCTVVPLQMAVSAMVFTVGCCNTDTVILSLAVHWPAEATVTKYSVVAVGSAMGL